MIQVLFGITVAIAGVAMLLERSWVLGVALLAFGGALANGAQHGVWLSFHLGGSDGGSSDGGSLDGWGGDGDGGGDGGGD